jgi:hypothetical protein
MQCHCAEYATPTSISNISQTKTNFEKLREVFVIWNVMNKNLLQFSKIHPQMLITQVLN